MRIVHCINLPAFGLIPSFINPADTRPMSEQIGENYQGGWNDFKGFSIINKPSGTFALEYKGDTPVDELGRIVIEDEILVIFDCSWCLNAKLDMEASVKYQSMIIKLETATIARID